MLPPPPPDCGTYQAPLYKARRSAVAVNTRSPHSVVRTITTHYAPPHHCSRQHPQQHPLRSNNELQGLDRFVLRGRVRRAGQSRRCGHRHRRRRRDQGLPGLHETVRKAQRRTGAEQRPRPGQPSQVFPQRGSVCPAVQGPEKSHPGDRQQRL